MEYNEEKVKKSDLMCKYCGHNTSNKYIKDEDGVVCIGCAKDNGLLVVEDKKNNNHYKVSNSRRYSSFWTTILSFIPGAGQMYLGFMNRGLQVMLAFFGIIALSSMTYFFGFITPLAAIVWFYGVFDCYNLRKKLEKGEEVEDKMFINFNIKNVNLYYVGIAVTIIGGISLIETVMERYMNNYYIRMTRSLIISVALVAIGVYLIYRERKSLKS
ncbi:hypothetical protein [Dethiothermospora halolimnae]|uniref:hypothetical protein n=1 Tax=Dethiothermospora halolimnae TaxID=3114390 RepID=UPI003CCB7D8F